jgi:hypothetical protein
MSMKPTALAAALMLGIGSVAIAKGAQAQATPAAPQQSTQAQTQTQTGTSQTSATHGATVSGAARTQADNLRQGETPPATPPGRSISEVARGQQDPQTDIDDTDSTVSGYARTQQQDRSEAGATPTSPPGQGTRGIAQGQRGTQADTSTGTNDETGEFTDHDTRASTHGETVSTHARSLAEQRREGTVPPATPPGQSVSQVAQGQRDYRRLDADGDGYLSASELQSDPRLSGQLSQYDSDGDGRISRSEWDAYRTQMAGADDDDGDNDD